MQVNKLGLMAGASMFNPAILPGRMMFQAQITRAPDENGGQGSGVTDGGNGGQAGGESGGNNNTGDDFDPKAFWQEPAQTNNGGGQNGNGESGGQQQQQQQQPQGSNAGRELAQRLESLPFGEVFTDKAMEAAAQGDLTMVNQAIQGQLRESTRQSVIMTAQLMQQHGQNLLSQMREMIQEHLGQRDNQTTLAQEFPIMAEDPAMKPIVEGMFNQAMKLANNDRKKAVEATRNMLRYMGKAGAADMDIQTPPANPDDTFVSPGADSLVQELLRRK